MKTDTCIFTKISSTQTLAGNIGVSCNKSVSISLTHHLTGNIVDE
jgi:hypothetical protein